MTIGVVLNTSLPSNSLKKKHNAITYHKVRKAVSAKLARESHIDGKDNIADILTKATDGPNFRKHTKAGLSSL